MAKSQTLVPTASALPGGDVFIPLNKLKKSPRNARKTPHSEAAIAATAASIAAKGLLQNLVVEPERDADGAETGFYLVTIGEGRRLAQLLRVRRKEIKKSEPIRCVIDTANDPAEISLDENVTREAMHPADQFDAFRDLAERQGRSAEEIATRFGVSAHVVRQRLRLAAISPRLMQLYREDDLNLDQLMAFALVDDHARQEQVYDKLEWNRSASAIRRELTQTHVPDTDRRAVFVGMEAYGAAGGTILRDLFTEDGGGYCEDAGLLDHLALAKLEMAAADVRAEGWNWVKVQIDYPHAHGLRRIQPEPLEIPAGENAAYEAAQAAYDALSEQVDDDDLQSEEVYQRLAAAEAEMERIDAKRLAYSPDDRTRAGAFVTLSHAGAVRVERGFLRPEDVAAQSEDDRDGAGRGSPKPRGGRSSDLPDSLVRDLSAHRTLGLRLALGARPDLALIAVTHALTEQTFYCGETSRCLDLRPVSAPLGGHAPGIDDTEASRQMNIRHAAWAVQMPRDVADLWAFVTALGETERMALFAHCAALTVDAVTSGARSHPQARATAATLATALRLDMAEHWSPTGEAYLGRVQKAQILDAVREARGEEVAAQLSVLKKEAMAREAEKLLVPTKWLPTMLRTSASVDPDGSGCARSENAAEAVTA